MDSAYGTCFLTWIHNPANLDYISLRLRPLCLEYPLVDVANALFRAVTQNWDQGKRRMLAFLLIRDEEMRQKAKSKLVEFAQKSKAKSLQLRRIQQQQQSQQQQPQPQQEQEQNYHSNHRGGEQGEEHSPRWHSYRRSESPRQLHALHAAPLKHLSDSLESVGSVESSFSSTTATIAPSAPMDHTTLEDIIAESLITGIDITYTHTSDSDIAAASVGSIRRHRYSPY
ncbi:hypothetical protein BGX31_003770 [Mortierella sp. GBA43]|nr:hypothetical protein BGX31_003770 [Mortierella sp. GBA43]